VLPDIKIKKEGEKKREKKKVSILKKRMPTTCFLKCLPFVVHEKFHPRRVPPKYTRKFL